MPSFQRGLFDGAPTSGTICGRTSFGLFGADPEPAHYMGYLVLQSADNREFDIIDGSSA